MVQKNQIFVKINEYNEILSIVDVVKNKITKAKETISEVNELKKQEDAELEAWTKNLEDVSGKISSMESILSNVNK
jgi:hypothetical protein